QYPDFKHVIYGTTLEQRRIGVGITTLSRWYGKEERKHSLAVSAKPMGKMTILITLISQKGRGVWESNPPGTAPSDPSAVLKTVRPTGAPTPPYLYGVFCHACSYLSSQSSHTLHTYLRQRFHHQFRLA